MLWMPARCNARASRQLVPCLLRPRQPHSTPWPARSPPGCRAALPAAETMCRAQLARGILGPLLDLIASTDDPSELQSAVALLLQLLRACPPPELAAAVGSGGPEQLLCRLLVATRALLAPAQPDSCVGVAGPLLAQLLKAFPAQLAAPAPAELLAVGDTGELMWARQPGRSLAAASTHACQGSACRYGAFDAHASS